MSEPLWAPLPDTGGTRWTIVFCNVTGRSPRAHRLLRWGFPSGFRHVLALSDDPAGLILVQLTSNRLQIAVLPGETVASRLEYYRGLAELAPVSAVEVAWAGDEDAWVPRLLNCVGVARALAGLPGKVQTPKGLALELSRGRRQRRWWHGWWWCPEEEERDQPGAQRSHIGWEKV